MLAADMERNHVRTSNSLRGKSGELELKSSSKRRIQKEFEMKQYEKTVRIALALLLFLSLLVFTVAALLPGELSPGMKTLCAFIGLCDLACLSNLLAEKDDEEG